MIEVSKPSSTSFLLNLGRFALQPLSNLMKNLATKSVSLYAQVKGRCCWRFQISNFTYVHFYKLKGLRNWFLEATHLWNVLCSRIDSQLPLTDESKKYTCLCVNKLYWIPLNSCSSIEWFMLWNHGFQQKVNKSVGFSPMYGKLYMLHKSPITFFFPRCFVPVILHICD